MDIHIQKVLGRCCSADLLENAPVCLVHSVLRSVALQPPSAPKLHHV